MPAIAIPFLGQAAAAKDLRLLRLLLAFLDSLASPRGVRDDRMLPPEWFKYPPV